jgi:hypothetical protein
MKAILVLTAALSLLVACSSEPGPDVAAKGFLDALKAADFVKVKGLLADENAAKELEPLLAQSDTPEGQFTTTLLKTVFQKINYQVIKTDTTGETANVMVKMTAPDFTKIDQSKLMAGVMSTMTAAESDDKAKAAKALADAMVKAINDPNLPTKSEDTTIPMKKINGAWKVASFGANALTGN